MAKHKVGVPIEPGRMSWRSDGGKAHIFHDRFISSICGAVRLKVWAGPTVVGPAFFPVSYDKTDPGAFCQRCRSALFSAFDRDATAPRSIREYFGAAPN